MSGMSDRVVIWSSGPKRLGRPGYPVGPPLGLIQNSGPVVKADLRRPIGWWPVSKPQWTNIHLARDSWSSHLTTALSDPPAGTIFSELNNIKNYPASVAIWRVAPGRVGFFLIIIKINLIHRGAPGRGLGLMGPGPMPSSSPKLPTSLKIIFGLIVWLNIMRNYNPGELKTEINSPRGVFPRE